MSAGEEEGGEAVAVEAEAVEVVKEVKGEKTSGVPEVVNDAVLENDTALKDVAGKAEESVRGGGIPEGEEEEREEGDTGDEKLMMMDMLEVKEEEEENYGTEEEEEVVTRFGDEEEDEVARSREKNSIKQGAEVKVQGGYIEDERATQHDNSESKEIFTKTNNDEERIGEYETVRIKIVRREMSVIEEEWEEESEDRRKGEKLEPPSKSEVVCSENLATFVLRETGLNVGRAWEEATAAWEEMTFTELVHRQEATHRREVYKTMSLPPENELMKGSERQLSEAELRVRRSLQRLDVPEWMKNAPPPQQGFLLRRRDYGSSSAPGGGWSAYSSKTASMTSLGSSRAVTPNTPTKVVIPTRVATRGVGGIGGITSPASNCSISPSPSDRSGSLFQYPISRWSTSRLNSGTTTPTGSVTSSRTTTTYARQPYLGWRSQTSLASLAGSQSSLTSTGSYLTAADRLALGITSYSQRFVKTTSSTQDKENLSSEANAAASKPENADQNDTGSTNGNVKLQVPADVADVHSSIKEVTSAIVHYCNESTPSPRASPRGSPRPDGRAPSPRRLVWVESSFVGSRPITSPETPTSSTHAITPTSQLNGHDLPESGEVTSRPPQPPGEYLLAW